MDLGRRRLGLALFSCVVSVPVVLSAAAGAYVAATVASGSALTAGLLAWSLSGTASANARFEAAASWAIGATIVALPLGLAIETGMAIRALPALGILGAAIPWLLRRLRTGRADDERPTPRDERSRSRLGQPRGW